MSSRLLPISLLRGHWKALSDYRRDPENPNKRSVPDFWTRFLIVIIPIVCGVAMTLGGRLAAPGALLAGVALLTGGFLGAFGQLSTLRVRLTDRAADYPDAESVDRDSIDETVAHILTASLFSAFTAVAIVLGMNFGADADGVVSGIWAGVIVALAVYVFLVFLIAVPRLYAAYVNINRVRAQLSGTHRD